jgi:hypothetical protein
LTRLPTLDRGSSNPRDDDYTTHNVARVAGAVSHPGSGFPKDKLSAMYVERCRHFMENPPGDDWNGVWTMTEK